MATTMLWEVLRSHVGDRSYDEGETREGTEAELGHLSPRVLRLIGPAGRKAESAPLNKAEGAAPANKARSGRKATKGQQAGSEGEGP